MADRVRLTDPRRASRDRSAVEDNTPYPGTVNQPERQFKKRDQYDIDWETINHPYPDMRTEWKNDSRDEIGFGIPEANGPTVASVRVAASKAVRAAVLMLGEKVTDEVIEAQARDFMSIGPDALDRTLERFVGSQELYVAEDDDKDDKKEDDKDDEDGKEASAALADKMSAVPPTIKEPTKAEEVVAEESTVTEEIVAEAAPVAAEEIVSEEITAEEAHEAAVRVQVDKIRAERAAAAVAAEELAIVAEAEARLSAEAEIESKTSADEKEDDKDEKKDEDKKEASADEKEDDKEDKKEASAPETTPEATPVVAEAAPVVAEAAPVVAEVAPVLAETRLTGPNEMDIELTSASSLDMTDEMDADPRLSSLFEDPDVAAAAALQTQPRKAGIKELGGQPRAMTASDGGGADLGSIWESAPDVSGVFR
jgi:hypothetical protein